MNLRRMKVAGHICACLLAAVIPSYAFTEPAPLALFNGTSLLGWNTHGTWVPGGGMISSGGSGDRNLLTAVPFADFSLQFEYNENIATGAKLRLWASRENTGGLSVNLDLSGAAGGIGSIETFSNSSITSLPSGWHRIQVDATRGQVNVRVDGLPSGAASGLGSRAGYVGFQANGSGTLQIRNIRLTPLNGTSAFNGADLNGWKSIARKPDAKGGVGHTMEKAFTFGMGGGSTKPHEAKWSVRNAGIHGEDGPGGLENGNVMEDAVIQLVASVKGEVKKDNFTALLLRNTPDQLSGGYAVGVGPYAGSIEHLENHAFARADAPVDETIVVGGRTIAVWVNGTLTSVHTDSRPESTNSAQGARTAGGPVMLHLPNNGEQIEVQRLSMTALPKTFGLPAHAPQAPPPVVQKVGPTPAATALAPTGPSAAETALLEQQKETAKKDANDQQNKQHVASLMGQALATTDPQQQMAAYGQVVQIDPSNAAAVQGYKEAQQKMQSQQEAQSKATNTAAAQQQDADTRDQQTNAALAQAQTAFLGGHLGAASNALSVAERLSPANPLVRELRSRIGAAQSLRSRLYFLGGGVGLLSLAGLVAMWLRRRRTQRYPVLEVTRGLDQGQSYPVEKDVTRLGAVAQDGGQRNEIVIRDIEHAVSRFHCEIVKRDGQLYVSDLNSSNGTRVNGTLVKPGSPELLRKGSRILLANSVELRFGYDRAAKKRN